jgi:hypothetical protein
MDKTSKAILAVIAAGLWANAAVTMLKPTLAHAQDAGPILYQIQTSVMSIANGVCTNRKLCG